MKIETKIKKLIDLIENIKENSFNIYNKNECPLNVNHYELSKILFGSRSYDWTCGFCGEKESD